MESDEGCRWRLAAQTQRQASDTASSAKLQSTDAQQSELSKPMSEIAEHVERTSFNATSFNEEVAKMKSSTDDLDAKKSAS